MERVLPELQKNRGRVSACHVLFVLGMLAVSVLYLYKLPLDIQGFDEAFYLTVPRRLLQGDVFIVDEWHGSQLSGFLLLPLVALRDLFCGEDGMVLQLRYIYLLVHALMCTAVYVRLRGHRWAAVCAALLLFIFTPYDITALSYNTMGLDLMALSMALLSTPGGRRSRFAAGLCFAGAVLCTPHLLAAFAVYSAAVLLRAAVRRQKGPVAEWLAFLGGCAVLAALLLVFTFSRTTPAMLLRCLPGVFTDPSHPKLSIPDKLSGYFAGFAFWSIQLCAYAAVLAVLAADRERRRHRAAYFALSAGLALWMLGACVPGLRTVTYNYIMFPLCLPGLSAYLLTEKKDRRAFAFLFLGGAAYTLCIHLASNQGFFIITAMSTVASLGSCLFIGGFLREVHAEYGPRPRRAPAYVCAAAALLLLAGQLSVMLWTKANHRFFMEAPARELTAVVPEGPYAGIRMTPKDAEDYLYQLAVLHRTLDGVEAGKTVLYGCGRTWYNLVYPGLRSGCYSGWIDGDRSIALERLNLYYGLNPAKVPDYIYLPKDVKWDMEQLEVELLRPYGFTVQESEDAYLFLRERAD